MRTIGLIGGMSWESSVEYYRIINEATRDRLGGTHSAKSVMYSVDFHEVEQLQAAGDWKAAAAMMAAAAAAIESAGADCIVICTNTMHLMADDVVSAVDIPLIHIADATAEAVKAAEIEKVALLGTRYTMEKAFYRGRLQNVHGLDVRVPNAAGREIVHRIIYEELVQGVIEERSRSAYLEVIAELIDNGAQGVIAGCTEIELLIEPRHVAVQYFPTTRLHALAAVEWALAD